MATKANKQTSTAQAAAAPAVPQPTHGGVYALVDGQLHAIEGGPPQAEAGESSAEPQPQGEGA